MVISSYNPKKAQPKAALWRWRCMRLLSHPFSSGYFQCASKCGMRTGCDKFETMRAWFDALVELGPIYGYFPKPSKCILLAKPERLDHARKGIWDRYSRLFRMERDTWAQLLEPKT